MVEDGVCKRYTSEAAAWGDGLGTTARRKAEGSETGKTGSARVESCPGTMHDVAFNPITAVTEGTSKTSGRVGEIGEAVPGDDARDSDGDARRRRRRRS